MGGCAEVRRVLGREGADDIVLPDRPVGVAVRLANRLAFGPRPGDVGRIEQMGRAEYFREQLTADLPEPLHLQLRLRRMEIYQFEPADLEGWPEETVIRQLQQAALLRATYSPNQLLERMVDFWSNHFNIYARKGHAMYRISKDQVEVVRRHALGRFIDLLSASARSPAMLAYLDNTENRRGVPNENYARELLELHTLGVHGGYTQRDVLEVARCFTGWGIETRFLRKRGQFRFDPETHDEGEKVVLGHRIPAGGGVEDGQRVLRILAAHPSCARYLASKFCRYFTGLEDGPLVERIARVYTRSGGNVRAMLQAIVRSQDLAEGPPLVKRPLDFVASALRALDADTDAGSGILDHLDRMGQPLHQWPMPDGYPDQTSSWTGSLLARWNFALALAGNQIPGTSIRADQFAKRVAVEDLTLPGLMVPKVIERSREPRYRTALCLMAPEFQWR